MSRLARQAVMFNGCYAHVISRSIRKMKLFRDDEDFSELCRLLGQAKQQSGFKIYHYCIMQTHFHLVVSIPHVQAFSRAIGQVKSRYSVTFHTKYRLSGPIWRGRFKGLLIEDNHYMRMCGQYIEQNPVKAGIVATPADWKHSSARHYDTSVQDELIDEYEGFDRIKKPAKFDFEEKEFFEKGRAIGSPFFRFQIYDKLKRV